MCGILACKLKRPLTEFDIQKLDRIRDSMKYRGPDANGKFVSKKDGVYLGHRRLSIIGLDSEGTQPMKKDNFVITFNGEIYNYVELAKQLNINGIPSNDTSVILDAWQKWGANSLNKLDGMYAFALWNTENKTLSLATDIFGEKPLFQYENEDGFYFCSEAKPLIDFFNIKFLPSKQDIADFLYLGYVLPTRTGFKNLLIIEPASLITVHSNQKIDYKYHWSLPDMHIGKGKIEKISAKQLGDIKNILCSSLEKRLRADVSIGLFLSGGVDSSLVAALAKEELGKNLQTYTVAFANGIDESEIACRIAQHLSLGHTVINSSMGKFWRTAPETLNNLYGVPNDNMTALAIYQMCEEAKKHFTVALSGLGGDEIFYGYNKYETFYRLRKIYRYSPIIHRIASFLKEIPLIDDKLQLAADLTKGTRTEQYLRVKGSSDHKLLKALYAQMPENLIPEDKNDIVHNVRNFDLRFSMPQSFIPAIDRGAMRASVEVRTPFLNRELVEYISTIDQRSLIAFGKKHILRKLLKNYMPLNILYKGKQGFMFSPKNYFLESNHPLPKLPFIKQTKLETFWNKKAQEKYAKISMRLSILDNLYASK